MTYKLRGGALLFLLDRTEIIDIAVGDVIEVESFPGARYTWTAHDGEFLENNPDADLYLQIERAGEDKFRAKSVVLK